MAITTHKYHVWNQEPPRSEGNRMLWFDKLLNLEFIKWNWNWKRSLELSCFVIVFKIAFQILSQTTDCILALFNKNNLIQRPSCLIALINFKHYRLESFNPTCVLIRQSKTSKTDATNVKLWNQVSCYRVHGHTIMQLDLHL